MTGATIAHGFSHPRIARVDRQRRVDRLAPNLHFLLAFDFHTIRIGYDPPFEDWYCRRHIKDGVRSRMCTMFSREPGADDE